MSDWNNDMSQAPRGFVAHTTVSTANGPRSSSRFIAQRLILATKCGKVTLSQYIPDEERWMMLSKGEEPVAWQRWPEHPSSEVETA
jgi:hypothetical protein